MAIVKVSFVKPGKNVRAGAKANIRYIQNRRGKEGAKITRTLFGSDGLMGRLEAYRMIDEAEQGSRFFRVIINFDAKAEDTERDLQLEAVLQNVIHGLEENLKRYVSYVGVVHDDHTPLRHIHALVIAKERLLPVQQMRHTATQICLEQRRVRDLLHEQVRERGDTVWQRERSK